MSTGEFQLGADFCCYRQLGSCPFSFMTCNKCPFSATYQKEFADENHKRFLEYRFKISIV